MGLLSVVLMVFGILIICWVVWRLGSQRYVLPCPTWLSWMVEMDNPFSKINRAATIVQNLGLKPGMQVLDIGCGPGRVTLPAARVVGDAGHVIAMDIQEGMLSKAKKKAEAAGLRNITYLHACVGSGKLEINKFDRVLLVTVLGEIPDQAAALREIFKALKPGGILSITEIIFDPHFQRKSKVLARTCGVGFQETAFFGNAIAYTLNLEKPNE